MAYPFRVKFDYSAIILLTIMLLSSHIVSFNHSPKELRTSMSSARLWSSLQRNTVNSKFPSHRKRNAISSSSSENSNSDGSSYATADNIWLTSNYLERDVLKGSAIGTSKENSPTLVLNADYTPLSRMPLSLWSWEDSVGAIISGKAKVVSEYSNIMIRSVSRTFAVPSVIVLSSFYHHPQDVPNLSRKFVYLRDDYCCQYCDKRFAITELTLDHLVPRSQGGKLTWTNTVTACTTCNFRKANRPPEDLPGIGMRLRNQPYAPSIHQLQQKFRLLKRSNHYHPHWQDFL